MRNALDRWLIRKFAVETHIYLVSDPGPQPRGVKRIELDTDERSQFRYQLIIKNDRLADAVVDTLQREKLSFRTKLETPSGLLPKLINPHGRSFTFAMIGRFLALATILSVLYLAYAMIFEGLFNDEVRGTVDFLFPKRNVPAP